jgi:RNA polymerase sigma-70 factor (ECF subfamily)
MIAAVLVPPAPLPTPELSAGGEVLTLADHRPAERIEDAELVERALAGDGWAREAMFRRHVMTVAAAARRLLRDSAEVDDVVQETFLIAFEQLPRLVRPAALRGWLLQIAISRVHRRFRSWRRWRLPPVEETAARLEEQAARGVSPEQRAELALVDRALEELALPLRTAWVLRHVEGHSLEDTAAACACSLATVKRRITRAEEVVQRFLTGRRS